MSKRRNNKSKQKNAKRKSARKMHPLAPRLAELVRSAVAAASTWSQTRSSADKLAARNAIVTAIGLYQYAEACSAVDARSGVVSLMALLIADDKPEYSQGDVYRHIGEKILGTEMPIEKLHIMHGGFDFSPAVYAALDYFTQVVVVGNHDVADGAADVVTREVMAVADNIASEGKLSRGVAAGATWHVIAETLATYSGVSSHDVMSVLIDIQRRMPAAYQDVEN